MPQASVNFVTAHDGFTAADVVSYAAKHNEANGQHNRDGNDDNRSVNCGVEGPTTDPKVLALRQRLQRTLLATLLLAQGTPMLTAGDAEGRTQGGNNNAYCQDNATSWIDWAQADAALQAFVARLLALRRAHPTLRRKRWFDGRPTPLGERDLTWLWHDGTEMTPQRWDDAAGRAFGCMFGRLAADEAAVLVLVNGSDAEAAFVLPVLKGAAWRLALDTADPLLGAEGARPVVEPVPVAARSLAVLLSAPAAGDA
jgi:glycogen operon protein